MRRRLKQIGISIDVLFVVMQFVPADTHNPSVNPSQTIYAISPVPSEVRNVIDSSCNDCHSNETRWPWYTRVAPA